MRPAILDHFLHDFRIGGAELAAMLAVEVFPVALAVHQREIFRMLRPPYHRREDVAPRVTALDIFTAKAVAAFPQFHRRLMRGRDAEIALLRPLVVGPPERAARPEPAPDEGRFLGDRHIVRDHRGDTRDHFAHVAGPQPADADDALQEIVDRETRAIAPIAREY